MDKKRPPPCVLVEIDDSNSLQFPIEGVRYPEPLVDLSERATGQPLPFVIDPQLVEAEKMTYAFFYRQANNMYAYVYKYADVLLTQPKGDPPPAERPEVPPPLLPAGGWR
jgi:hypothetical protein